MDNSIWQAHWERLVDKWSQTGYESFTQDERIWFNVQCLTAAVNDGGLISYYYNSGADYMEETLDDLNKLEAQQVIAVLGKVNELFPNAKPPKDIEQRNVTIDSWGENEAIEELLDIVDDEFYQLVDGLELKLEPVIQRVISRSSVSSVRA